MTPDPAVLSDTASQLLAGAGLMLLGLTIIAVVIGLWRLGSTPIIHTDDRDHL